ncbi:expressed unknown protein [Seminavis robusta]|uniref:Uncharacterized protein n=1 Tax=Seminavis robusta TaxID=568900 RepID=A0A9N8EFD3_9STRA|nr:expressed unknown protein [Seminavis robusta]|eukprot:Sro856_g211530.1 n/a (393) ;mRNA; f:15146-16525
MWSLENNPKDKDHEAFECQAETGELLAPTVPRPPSHDRRLTFELAYASGHGDPTLPYSSHDSVDVEVPDEVVPVETDPGYGEQLADSSGLANHSQQTEDLEKNGSDETEDQDDEEEAEDGDDVGEEAKKEEKEEGLFDGDNLDLDLDSIQDDSVSTVHSAEDREAAIREGFFGFFFGYISDSIGCGAFDQLMASLMALMAPIVAMGTKLLKKVKGEDDNGQEDAVQEIIDNVQGTGANPFTSGGGGGGGGGPPPGVAEMATAASQGAASAGAAGAASAGAAAAGASIGGIAGVAGAVAGAGLAAQAGVAVGVAAVAAAAVSGGVAMTTSVVNTTVPVNLYGDFVPPFCSEASDNKFGYVELTISGIPPSALEDNEARGSLEDLFRNVYNEIT